MNLSTLETCTANGVHRWVDGIHEETGNPARQCVDCGYWHYTGVAKVKPPPKPRGKWCDGPGASLVHHDLDFDGVMRCVSCNKPAPNQRAR